MKRSQFKRRTQLWSTGRRSPPGSRRTRHARRPRAFDYMGWVKAQPCLLAVSHAPGCSGPVEADHAGNRFTDGDGTRAYDRTCIPLCRQHHHERTNMTGAFAHCTAGPMRIWCDAAIDCIQRRAREQGVAIPDC